MAFGAGTTTYTVGSVMDRLYATYLTPPDAQYAQARLGSTISTPAQTTVILSGFAVPEDEALLRSGALLEIEQELMRVVSYDASAGTATVDRGEYDTPTSTYSTPKMVNLNPPFPRASVFEAVADNILSLYPSLFTVRTIELAPSGYKVYGIPDDLAVEISKLWPDVASDEWDIQGEIVDYHPDAGGRALMTDRYTGSVWLKYTRRMGKASAETDELADLGCDERWVTCVMAGAAADLLVGRDISAAHTEWVKNILEAENIRVGTRMSLAGGLREYRRMLLDDFRREMKAEYGTRVRMKRVTNV